MNTLCEQFEYSSLKPNLSYHFIKDLDIIIEQIKISNKKCIVEICIECNDLSWNTDKFITVLDYKIKKKQTPLGLRSRRGFTAMSPIMTPNIINQHICNVQIKLPIYSRISIGYCYEFQK